MIERSRAWQRGLTDIAKGYAALAAGAALSAAACAVFGTGALADGTSSHLPSSALIDYSSTTSWTSWAVAVVAGLGGALLLVINRRVLTFGTASTTAAPPPTGIAGPHRWQGHPSRPARGLAGSLRHGERTAHGRRPDKTDPVGTVP